MEDAPHDVASQDEGQPPGENEPWAARAQRTALQMYSSIEAPTQDLMWPALPLIGRNLDPQVVTSALPENVLAVAGDKLYHLVFRSSVTERLATRRNGLLHFRTMEGGDALLTSTQVVADGYRALGRVPSPIPGGAVGAYIYVYVNPRGWVKLRSVQSRLSVRAHFADVADVADVAESSDDPTVYADDSTDDDDVVEVVREVPLPRAYLGAGAGPSSGRVAGRPSSGTPGRPSSAGAGAGPSSGCVTGRPSSAGDGAGPSSGTPGRPSSAAAGAAASSPRTPGRPSAGAGAGARPSSAAGAGAAASSPRTPGRPSAGAGAGPSSARAGAGPSSAAGAGAGPPMQCWACYALETDEDTVLVRAPCSGVYCRDCLNTLVRTAGGKPLQCSHDGPRAHPLVVTSDMGRLLDTETLSHFVSEERKRSADSHFINCPLCKRMTVVPYFGEFFCCTQEGCVSPAYGFCRRCRRGVDTLPHSCRTPAEKENDRLAGEYLVQQGIMPCPGCRNAAIKLDPLACNHITCACGTRYCGSCGYLFPLNERGTANYTHACNVDSNYARSPAALRAVYAAMLADP